MQSIDLWIFVESNEEMQSFEAKINRWNKLDFNSVDMPNNQLDHPLAIKHIFI
jgi:hypothetical protein